MITDVNNLLSSHCDNPALTLSRPHHLLPTDCLTFSLLRNVTDPVHWGQAGLQAGCFLAKKACQGSALWAHFIELFSKPHVPTNLIYLSPYTVMIWITEDKESLGGGQDSIVTCVISTYWIPRLPAFGSLQYAAVSVHTKMRIWILVPQSCREMDD